MSDSNRSPSSLTSLLAMIFGQGEEAPRAHIARGEGQHGQLAQEVIDLIERRIKEMNPGNEDPACEDCVINVAAIVMYMSAANMVERGIGHYAGDALYQMGFKVATVGKLADEHPERMRLMADTAGLKPGAKQELASVAGFELPE